MSARTEVRKWQKISQIHGLEEQLRRVELFQATEKVRKLTEARNKRGDQESDAHSIWMKYVQGRCFNPQLSATLAQYYTLSQEATLIAEAELLEACEFEADSEEQLQVAVANHQTSKKIKKRQSAMATRQTDNKLQDRLCDLVVRRWRRAC